MLENIFDIMTPRCISYAFCTLFINFYTLIIAIYGWHKYLNHIYIAH